MWSAQEGVVVLSGRCCGPARTDFSGSRPLSPRRRSEPELGPHVRHHDHDEHDEHGRRGEERPEGDAVERARRRRPLPRPRVRLPRLVQPLRHRPAGGRSKLVRGCGGPVRRVWWSCKEGLVQPVSHRSANTGVVITGYARGQTPLRLLRTHCSI